MADTKKTTTTKKPVAKKKPVKATVAKKVIPKVKKEIKTPSKTKQTLAVINLAGSQYLIEKGKEYIVEDLNLEKGTKVNTEEVLLVISDGESKIGKPFVKGAKVSYEVTSAKRGKKLRVFKFKAKSRYRRTYGHRADVNRIKVTQIKSE